MTANPTDTAGLPEVRPDAARLAAIDGLRGIAVLMVLVTHFCRHFWGMGVTPWDNYFQIATQGMEIGVDLFFVISGFLITSILTGTRTHPRYFWNFYMRRGLRIFPLYYFCLLVLAVYSLGTGDHLFPGGALPDFYFLLHMSNLLFILDGWHHATVNPMYSLAMEEQYYLFFPMVVYLLTRRGVAWFLVGMLVLSAALRAAIIYGGLGEALGLPNPKLLIYCNVLARSDGLAFGGLLAVLHHGNHLDPWRRWFAPVAAVLLVVFASVFVQLKGFWVSTFPGLLGVFGYTTICLFFAMVLACLLTNAVPLLTRAMRARWLVSVGFFSYSIYLFHNFLDHLATTYLVRIADLPPLLGSRVPTMAVYTVVMTAATYALALVTWRLVEGPALSLKHHFKYQKQAGG